MYRSYIGDDTKDFLIRNEYNKRALKQSDNSLLQGSFLIITKPQTFLSTHLIRFPFYSFRRQAILLTWMVRIVWIFPLYDFVFQGWEKSDYKGTSYADFLLSPH